MTIHFDIANDDLYPRMPPHPIQPKATQIAKCILKHLGFRSPYLAAFDVYQVDEIECVRQTSMITLTMTRVKETPDSGTYRVYITIDFDTGQVYEYLGKARQIPIPSEIIPVLDDLRTFLRQHGGDSETKDRNAKVRAFYNRLLENQLITPDLAEVLDYQLCPVCSRRLISCGDCMTVSCEDEECPGAKIIPFEQCSSHTDRWYCHPCLDDMGYRAKLAQCPQCEYWFCSHEFEWCAGRPYVQAPDVTSHSDPKRVYTSRVLSTKTFTTERSHQPKPTPCITCTINSGNPPRKQCHNRHCWSRISYYHNVLCSDCTSLQTREEIECMCGRWSCGDCAAEEEKYAYIRCPRCQTVYCEDCRYVQRCARCRRSTLCSDCVEESASTSSHDQDSIRLSAKCERRGEQICESCAQGK
ncbi:hypothetical protein BJ138DRAFT_757000 [Hygrophoropsis aurantiaca]|uniref:Uncharacterized protein n=1 Tax=Hygrophoropsis aurantiaca TaxID=72124 RepID=A0ACB8AIU3_9AGAM|nr:hypothetical protein BJ138DRAFT_757000 [Hygrophoropsis aurantiaca]